MTSTIPACKPSFQQEWDLHLHPQDSSSWENSRRSSWNCPNPVWNLQDLSSCLRKFYVKVDYLNFQRFEQTDGDSYALSSSSPSSTKHGMQERALGVFLGWTSELRFTCIIVLRSLFLVDLWYSQNLLECPQRLISRNALKRSACYLQRRLNQAIYLSEGFNYFILLFLNFLVQANSSAKVRDASFIL